MEVANNYGCETFWLLIIVAIHADCSLLHGKSCVPLLLLPGIRTSWDVSQENLSSEDTR